MVSGVVASIRWAYYDAAAINGYTVTRDKDTREWSVSANIVIADAFKLSQRPLYLVVPYKGGCWMWRIRDPVPLVRGPFFARLSDPIEATHADTTADLLSASGNGSNRSA